MEDLQLKISVIDEIIKRHPSYGLKKGWSEYTGGMKDSGEWYFRKMLDVPLGELQAFLDDIIVGENKPKIPLSEEDERLSKIFYENEYGTVSGLHLKKMNQMKSDVDKQFFESIITNK